MRRALVLLVFLAACSSTPGIEATFCEGHADGVKTANNVALQSGLPGPVSPPCPVDRIGDIPDDQTPAQVHCYGWVTGYVDVALSHFPDQPPSSAWMVSTLEACVAAQPPESS